MFSTLHPENNFMYLSYALVSLCQETRRQRYSYNLEQLLGTLSSSLLSKGTKIKVYRTIIFPVVLYGCETWSLTVRDERRLRAFENRVLRRIFWPKWDEVSGENYIMRSFMVSTQTNIVRVIKSRRIGWAEHVARMGERCIQGFGGET
jgi:hypothetical protein